MYPTTNANVVESRPRPAQKDLQINANRPIALQLSSMVQVQSPVSVNAVSLLADCTYSKPALFLFGDKAVPP